MLKNTKHDLLVIGSGTAGHKAAIPAAKLGKSVALIDRKTMIDGGSLHGDTIPSKTLRETILYLSELRQRGFCRKEGKTRLREKPPDGTCVIHFPNKMTGKQYVSSIAVV